jgi:uncharacterized repeat protein (TIGR01451 family)
MNRMLVAPAFALALIGSMLLPHAADAAAHVTLTQSVVAIDAQNGAPLASASHTRARPGDRLRYVIVAKNDGDRPVTRLMPVAMIPAGERFIDTPAAGAAERSIDGGKTYAHRPLVRVTQPDGTVTMRPALAREINALRWVTPGPLAPGAHLTFAYDVSVE